MRHHPAAANRRLQGALAKGLNGGKARNRPPAFQKILGRRHMSYEAILYETRGPVAIITLNKPERLNAIGNALREEVHAAVEAAGKDDAIRAAIITGAGERGFCSGADLAGAADRAAAGVDATPSLPSQGERLDETGWVGRWARRFAHF